MTILNKNEREFISTIAADFIASYTTAKGEIYIEGEDDPEELLKEIKVCMSLIKKINGGTIVLN